MFIQTEQTPNPETLKFLPGRIVVEGEPASFSDSRACAQSPLAGRLLQVYGVTSVFFGYDFITITKKPDVDWFVLKPALLGIMLEHFVANLPTFIAANNDSSLVAPSQQDDPLAQQIREIINTRVRPAVAQDGGDIVFHSFNDGVVYLQMQGACSGCPSSQITLKNGIENMLRYYVPEVLEVKAV